MLFLSDSDAKQSCQTFFLVAASWLSLPEAVTYFLLCVQEISSPVKSLLLISTFWPESFTTGPKRSAWRCWRGSTTPADQVSPGPNTSTSDPEQKDGTNLSEHFHTVSLSRQAAASCWWKRCCLRTDGVPSWLRSSPSTCWCRRRAGSARRPSTPACSPRPASATCRCVGPASRTTPSSPSDELRRDLGHLSFSRPWEVDFNTSALKQRWISVCDFVFQSSHWHKPSGSKLLLDNIWINSLQVKTRSVSYRIQNVTSDSNLEKEFFDNFKSFFRSSRHWRVFPKMCCQFFLYFINALIHFFNFVACFSF